MTKTPSALFQVSILICCCIAGLSLALQSTINLGVDIGVDINLARRIYGGEHLYRDLYEVNLPLVFYLELPIVWLTHYFHYSEMTAAMLYHSSLAGISLALSAGLLWKSRSMRTPLWDSMFIIALFFSALLLPFCLNDNQFGQKEHLFILLTLPYFISLFCWSAHEKPYPFSMRLLIGLLAGVGFCIKPFFVVAFIVSELAHLIWSRRLRDSFRIETLAIGMLLLLYPVTVFLLLPEYFFKTLPLISHSYLFFNESHSNVTRSLLIGLLFLSGGGIILMPVLALCIKSAPQRYLMALTLSMFAIAALQMKGWSYHLYPYAAIYCLTIPAILSDIIINRHKLKEKDPLVSLEYGAKLLTVFCFILVLCAYYPSQAGSNITRSNELTQATAQIDTLLDHRKPAHTIYCFCTAAQSVHPLVNRYDYQNVTFFDALWMVSAIENALDYYAGNSEKEPYYHDLKQQFISDVVSNFIARQPDILIKEKVQIMRWGKQSDIFDYFAADPRFNKELSNYSIKGQVHMAHNTLAIYQRD